MGGNSGAASGSRIMIDYDQQNWTHQYDLWQHSLHTVLGVPRGIDDDMLYLAACCTMRESRSARLRGNAMENQICITTDILRKASSL